MSLFFKYIKQRKGIFATAAVLFVVFLCSFQLYHLPIGAVIYPTLICALIGVVIMPFDFARVKREHETMMQIKSITDTIEGIFPHDCDIKNEDYRQIIRLIGEEHAQYRAEAKRKYSDMIDYYTVWAHQIKTPIASMRLHLESEDTPLSRKLTSDLYRIEQYVEMVLTFLRLNSESTDYLFSEYDLDRIVREAVKKLSSEFINRKLRLIYQPINTTVITDEKWLSFVIEQVLSNSLKYTRQGSITITIVGDKTLRIQDTGIGIAPEDLPRIFENGYTGYNGRTDKRASGIGLYLCRRVCENLGHKISASSVVDVGTTVDIDLSQTRLTVE